MDEFSNIWIAQCDAARGIRHDWGTQKAGLDTWSARNV